MANNEFTIPIPARLKNVAKGGHVAGAKDIIDDNLGKEQSVINQEVSEAIEGNTQAVAAERQRAVAAEGALDNRLSDIEELAEISIDGGEAKIATGEDFHNPTAEQRAKIPTVGAILDGADDEPTAGSNNLVKSGGIYNSIVDYICCIATSDSTAIASGKITKKGDKYFNKNDKNIYICSSYTNSTTMTFVILSPAKSTKLYKLEDGIYTYNGNTLVNLLEPISKRVTNIEGKNVYKINCFANYDAQAQASGKITSVGDLYFNALSKTIYICTSYTDSSTMSFAGLHQVTYNDLIHFDEMLLELISISSESSYLRPINKVNIVDDLNAVNDCVIRGSYILTCVSIDGSTIKYIDVIEQNKRVLYFKNSKPYYFNGNYLTEISTQVEVAKCIDQSDAGAIQSGKITAVGDKYINGYTNTLYICSSYTNSSTMSFTKYESLSNQKLYLVEGELYYFKNGIKLVKGSETQEVIEFKCFAGGDIDAIASGEITAKGDKYINIYHGYRIYICTSYTDSSHMTFAVYEEPSKDHIYIKDGELFIYNGTKIVSATSSGSSEELRNQVNSNTSRIVALEHSDTTQSNEIEQIEEDVRYLQSHIDDSPSSIIAFQEELSAVQQRLSNVEDEIGTTPPSVTGYVRIATLTVVSQSILDNWQNCLVDIIGDLQLTGSSNFTIPNSCILNFKGGKFISNNFTGTLIANNAYINAMPIELFDASIMISGTFRASVSYGEWFGAVGNGVHQDASTFNKTLRYCVANELHLVPNKTYALEAPIVLNNATLKGCQTAKLIRKQVWLDIPIVANITEQITAVDGKITLGLDTSSTYFANLTVGTCINIVPRDVDDRDQSHYEWINRIVTEINPNGTIVVNGGDFTRVGAVSYNVINEYQLINMMRIAKVKDVVIDGGLDLIPYNRAYWRMGASIGAGIQDFLQPNGISQTFNYLVENCIIDNSVADAIETLGVHGTIRHNVIRHAGANGIHFSYCSNISIENNYFFDTNINSLTGHNEGGITYSNCIKNIFIRRNFFDNCLNCIGNIGFPDHSRTIISDNIFSNFRMHGVYAQFMSTLYGNMAREFIISNNQFLATNIQYHSWESSIEEIPIVPRSVAKGKGIYVIRAAGAVGEQFVVNGNIFKDCGIVFNYCNDLLITNNNIKISYEYGEGETKPAYLLDIDKCKGVISGNVLKNTSVTTMNNLVIITNSDFVLSSNVYNNAGGSFLSQTSSSIEQQANKELSADD